jgi:RHS repeat-associated protein
MQCGDATISLKSVVTRVHLGHLARITDILGLASQFQYSASVPDFLEALTTPYGTTTFATGEGGLDRWIEITDPLGAKERILHVGATSALATEPVPQGFTGSYLQYRNTFHWDKHAYASGAAGDVKKARVFHWLHTPDGTLTSGTLESEKMPLENRVWYAYPGQSSFNLRGTSTLPIRTARVLDDGTTQLFQSEYNARGKKTKEIDPLGRETVYVYGTNNVPDADPVNGTGIDLLQVKRKNGGSYDVLQSFSYNDKHQPMTITDARGAVTTYTYNTAGQVLSVTTPPAQGHSQGATTAFTYDTDGRLQQVSGPVPGATTSFTYDAYGRRRTVTDAAGLVLTYDYDALDRVTRVSYPDSTYEETVYKWLDVEKRRDRLGRWTQTVNDALGRVVATRDALGGTTQYQYGAAGCSACSGGGEKLSRLIDANGNVTSWDHDLQGRVLRETRADGSHEQYVYETTSSRLKQKIDRKNVTTSFEYFLDGKLKRKSYSDATPAVSYTYDPVDGLMLTAANGTDTLTWTYDNLDRVSTEASVKNASTVAYTYDDAGNRVTLSLDGATHLTYGYDPQSRLTSITRGSSIFEFAYDTASRRSSMTYPNGVVTTYGYDGESRLTSLAANKDATPITSFSYVLDAIGNRTRKTTLDWAEDYGYDPLYRLVSADRSSGSPSRWRFAYDGVGNRTADQTDDASNGAVYNSLNQLLGRAPGGALAFRGTTNEVAAVTVAGQPAQTASDNTFSAQAPVLSGTTDVAVTATDPSGNARTNTYRVTAAGAGTSYTYDPNGNLTSKTEGTDNWVYAWNAENQLITVEKNGVEQARFAYDPLGRRVEKVTGGLATSYAHDAEDILREVKGATTLRYVHGPRIDEPISVEAGPTSSYFHADGLTNVVATTDAVGVVASSRRYDPWGSIEAGASELGYSFTGREWDPEIGLYYYRARYYDPGRGRFISEDPTGQNGGLNFYRYVEDNPVNFVDPFGLETVKPCGYTWIGLAGAFGDRNNQVIFCAPCSGKCKERVIKAVHWGNAPPVPPGVEPPAAIASVPTKPSWDGCKCNAADKVYVNIQTRHAIFREQYMLNVFVRGITLEYECK